MSNVNNITLLPKTKAKEFVDMVCIGGSKLVGAVRQATEKG